VKYRLLILTLLSAVTATAQHCLLQLEHVVNGQPMVLQTTAYQNSAGDTFNITVFKYYLSNISFTNSENKVVAGKNCFLVSEDSAASKKIALNLPAGHYKRISFMIGVDSLLNCTGAKDGALDPIYGMFWTWNTGYIMAKLEGTSPSSKLPGRTIQFHIGGYRAPHITQRIVTLPISMVIQPGTTPRIILTGDAYTWFTNISFRQLAGFMTPGTAADRIADNYQHMFSVKEVTN
jgi:hypothetical protein